MSYNEIAETFSEYSKVKSKNCQHLIELFEQAMIQMQEEEIIMVEHPNTPD
jgi:glutamate racemase|tara:strand:+ start:410 stop:562 length:153 start_codon:yes stop_codon:yes gene_type:complete